MRLVNIAVLLVSFSLLGRLAPTGGRQLAIVGGLIFISLVLTVSLSRAARERLRSVAPGWRMRAILALAPWITTASLVFARGLWWTQRPAPLRFFLLYVLVNWSLACCFIRTEAGAPRGDAVRRAVLVLAAILAGIGIEGAAFGMMPFGCAVSMLVALVSVGMVIIAAFGTRPSGLKTFVATVAAVLAVGVMELAVRAARLGQNVQEVDSREYARQFYSLTPPNAAFINRPNALDEFPPALVSINSRGIRGPELSAAETDLLLIGDSMIEARQLPWEQTLGPHLEQALRDRSIPRRVVAHGMRGWSPLLEWNWYLKVGRQLKPKTVLLFFFWNDMWLHGDEPTTFSAVLGPEGRPRYFDVPVDANYIWYKRVRVIRLAADTWQRLSIAQVQRAFSWVRGAGTTAGRLSDDEAERLARTLNEPPLSREQMDALLTTPVEALPPDLRALTHNGLWPLLRPFELWSSTQKEAAGRTAIELGRFSEDVSRDGARLVIVHVPNPLQVGARECSVGRLFGRIDTNVVLPPTSGLQSWLRSVSAEHGIEVLDPTDAMRQWTETRPADDRAPLYLRADCHWTERGHRFMARYVADWYAARVAESVIK